MCSIANAQSHVLTEIVEALPPGTVATPDLWDYALLVFATDTPIDRALTYLEDTGSPVHATGRLLLRAAERALRANGVMPEVAYGAEADLGAAEQ